jgi:hypothetical protein
VKGNNFHSWELVPETVFKEKQAERPKMHRGRPRKDGEREVLIDGVSGYMLHEDGTVRPEWREHVAALRKRPELCSIGEVVTAAQSRRG